MENGWIAVVGARQVGRSALVQRLGHALHDAGVPVGGFVQLPCVEGDELSGYDLVHITRGETVPLARESKTDPELCRWGFFDHAFETARRWTLADPHAVTFVEAGRLEAAERGHWPTLLASLGERPLTVVSIRPSVLASVALRLPDPIDAIELPADSDEVERFVARVKNHPLLEGRA